MPSPLRLLHLEENPCDAGLVLALLAEDGLDCQATHVTCLPQFLAALKADSFDLILSDLSPSIDGFAALAAARESRPETPFIIATGVSGEETHVAAMQQGATDYVLKARLSLLAPAVKKALGEVHFGSK